MKKPLPSECETPKWKGLQELKGLFSDINFQGNDTRNRGRLFTESESERYTLFHGMSWVSIEEKRE